MWWFSDNSHFSSSLNERRSCKRSCLTEKTTVNIWQQIEMFNKDTLPWHMIKRRLMVKHQWIVTQCCRSLSWQENIGGMKQSCTLTQHSNKQHFSYSEHAATCGLKKRVLRSLCSTLNLFQIKTQTERWMYIHGHINRSESCIRLYKSTFTKIATALETTWIILAELLKIFACSF